MKLGLFTAAFPKLTLQEIAGWAEQEGFQTLEIACWPTQKAERRYAGVCHIDVNSLDKERADAILELLEKHRLTISALGYYPNPLDPDPGLRTQAIEHIKKVIQAASLLRVPVVGTFIGRDPWKTVEQNLEVFSRVWPPIVLFARDHGVKIAIENCPMLFSYDEWPGGKNLATCPAIWDRMWEMIPGDNFGLNLDPSHLVLQMIDPIRVVREYQSKIFHVHAKDLMIDREGLYRHGVFSCGMGWGVPRLPGLGDMDWKRFLSELYRVGYNGVISIEHEDRTFEGSEELVKKGFLIARDVLKPYIR